MNIDLAGKPIGCYPIFPTLMMQNLRASLAFALEQKNHARASELADTILRLVGK